MDSTTPYMVKIDREYDLKSPLNPPLMLPVQRPTCVLCQNDLDPGEPFCDECGADQKSGRVILKSSKHDDACSNR